MTTPFYFDGYFPGLVLERHAQLSKTDKIVFDVIEETVAREDLRDWALRPEVEQKMTQTILEPRVSPIRSLTALLP